MEKTTITFILLLTTIALWLLAVCTPGWFFVTINRELKVVQETSIFYIRTCEHQTCTSESYYENSNMLYPWMHYQIEATVPLMLYVISSILVLAPHSCSCHKQSALTVVTSLLPIAESTKTWLILEFAVVNASGDEDTFGFPYSLLLAGLSLLNGIIAFLFNFSTLHSLTDRNTGNRNMLKVDAGDTGPVSDTGDDQGTCDLSQLITP